MTNTAVQDILSKMKLPVISAPMFIVSGPKLVIEACKNGIIGSFPLLNARTEIILEEWMQEITTELAEAERLNPEQKIAPWAVNLIVHRSNTRYETDLEIIKKYKPPIVITSLGKPESVAQIVHEYGGVVFSDVATVTHAKKAAETGVDGLILVSNGAGGHAGTINPFAFIGAVKKFWSGAIILAGCISKGEDILAAQALGADFAYMGTRFIPTTESNASEGYQQMITETTLDDLMYTDAFSGIKANYLVPSIKKAGIDPLELTGKGKVDLSALTDSGAKAWKDIWSAGQGISVIDEVMPIADVVNILCTEYEAALAKLFQGEQVKS